MHDDGTLEALRGAHRDAPGHSSRCSIRGDEVLGAATIRERYGRRTEPTADEIVAILFRAAMSGDRDAYAREHDLDPKLLELSDVHPQPRCIAHL